MYLCVCVHVRTCVRTYVCMCVWLGSNWYVQRHTYPQQDLITQFDPLPLTCVHTYVCMCVWLVSNWYVQRHPQQDPQQDLITQFDPLPLLYYPHIMYMAGGGRTQIWILTMIWWYVLVPCVNTFIVTWWYHQIHTHTHTYRDMMVPSYHV